ncbi:Methyl-accepting chemotaxis protein 1 (plasmid) [Hartmannibacter diazotrophicus]|uniref:Methyl-accepting chemotaxis protein 1 n=1 Tax=Hartmannibacter diazotrophicus TaxID=1482074 RepID=A0A2C9DEE6_9HYPH|nr:methyl-accepting chemotaxis protein [Hartmannibacter diazotrophicus]SON58471.1 Methyl-accepting chemotaxis protein 1 [Hartmannibacter diazotrophicus]
MRLTINSMLMSAFVSVILLSSLQGVHGLRSLSSANDNLHSFSEVNLSRSTTVGKIQSGFANLRLAEGIMLVALNPLDQEKALPEIESAILAVNTQLISLGKNYDASSTDDSAFSRFLVLWRDYVNDNFNFIDLLKSGNFGIATDMYLAEMGSSFAEASDKLETLSQVEKSFASEASDKAELDYSIAKYSVSAALVCIILFGIVAIVFVWRGVSAPLLEVTHAVQSIARGDLTATIPNFRCPFEIEQISGALKILRDSLAEAADMRIRQADREASTATAMLEERERIANTFQEKMGSLAERFVGSARDLAGAAQGLSATAEQTSEQAHNVSGAARGAAHNVQSVAASTEELSASVHEITAQVTRSVKISEEASGKAAMFESNIRLLSTAASEIGEVVSLISEIAEQTNLLALNATIEAARAGEAGRGFAVVASEVKSLAGQTAKATDGIAKKVQEIQVATESTVCSIEEIVQTIKHIQESSASIAGAVEQQGAATSEIASNTQRAAEAAQNVSAIIGAVGDSANTTGIAAGDLLNLSGQLERQSLALQDEVVTFVAKLRTG